VQGCEPPARFRLTDSKAARASDVLAFAQEFLAASASSEALKLAGFPDDSATLWGLCGMAEALRNLYVLGLAAPGALPSGCCANSCTTEQLASDLLASAMRKSGGVIPSDLAALVARAPLHLLFGDVNGCSGRYYGGDALRSPIDACRAPGSPAFCGSEEDPSAPVASRSSFTGHVSGSESYRLKRIKRGRGPAESVLSIVALS
jgi:carbonyl reductase 1